MSLNKIIHNKNDLFKIWNKNFFAFSKSELIVKTFFSGLYSKPICISSKTFLLLTSLIFNLKYKFLSGFQNSFILNQEESIYPRFLATYYHYHALFQYKKILEIYKTLRNDLRILKIKSKTIKIQTIFSDDYRQIFSLFPFLKEREKNFIESNKIIYKNRLMVATISNLISPLIVNTERNFFILYRFKKKSYVKI
nr:hypothetical protein 1634Bnrm3_p032 [Cryptomonas sp.]